MQNIKYSIFTMQRYASVVYAEMVSVYPPVCNTPVLYQNGQMYDHANNAVR